MIVLHLFLGITIWHHLADILEPVNCAGAQNEMFNSEVSGYGSIVNEDKCTLDDAGRVSEIVVSPRDMSPSKGCIVPDSPMQSGCSGRSVGRSQLQTDAKIFGTAGDDSIAVHIPPFDEKCEDENIGSHIAGSMATKPLQLPDRHCGVDIAEYDLSPRLTNLIESGFVPESPLSNSGSQNGEGKNKVLVPEPTSSSRARSHRNSSTFSSEKVNINEAPQRRDVNPSPVQDQIRNPLADGTSEIGGTPESPFNPVFRTPQPNSAKSSCSEDWRMNSGEKSGTGERPLRLKRLRKIGDLGKDRLQNGEKKKATCPSTNLALRVNRTVRDVSNCIKARRPYEDARDFIDVEAEVSSEDMVQDSEDDGEQEHSDHYEDSFIDDRIEPTVGTSEADDSAVDMMAVYRRSLLTQSPFQGQQSHSAVVTPQSMDSIATTTEGGECSGKISTWETPQYCSKSQNVSAGKSSICLHLERVTCQAIPGTSGRSQVTEVFMDSRQTEMDSTRAFTLPVKNLEKDFSLHSGLLSKEQPLPVEANGNDSCCATLSDDQFFEGLDLDALEAEATKLLSQRTRSSVPSKRISEPSPKNAAFFGSPSFDLGIL